MARHILLSEYLRTMQQSQGSYRDKIANLMRDQTMRCGALTLYPEEARALEGVVAQLEAKMQKDRFFECGPEHVLPLTTWLNTLFLHNRR